MPPAIAAEPADAARQRGQLLARFVAWHHDGAKRSVRNPRRSWQVWAINKAGGLAPILEPALWASGRGRWASDGRATKMRVGGRCAGPGIVALLARPRESSFCSFR